MINPNIIIIVGVLVVGIWSLKKLRDNFSMALFYLIGMLLFIVQGIAGTYGLIIQWNFLLAWGIISKIASLMFSFLIAYFFYFLKNQVTPKKQKTALTPEEIYKFLEGEKDGA